MEDLQVLLSCMHQKDASIIENSNLLKCGTVIVNQCDVDETLSIGKTKWINTTTRGLSVSRNLAISSSTAKIGLLSDDDEYFVDHINDVVVSTYKELPKADIIIFKMTNYPTKLGNKTKKLRKYDLLKVSSCQISFKIEPIKCSKIVFDENLGAGTNNGCSEENKFLLDCYKKGLQIYFVPKEIATLKEKQSTWFNSYDKIYFYNRGKTTRYILGVPMALLYAGYFLIFKHKIYKKDISMFKALKNIIKGIFTKDINKKYE